MALDALMDEMGRKVIDNAGKVFSFVFGVVGWLVNKLLKKLEESIIEVNIKCDDHYEELNGKINTSNDELKRKCEKLEEEVATLSNRLSKLEGAHEVNHKG